MANPSKRDFVNELGRNIHVGVSVGEKATNKPYRCQIRMRGPLSETTNNVTRIELEQLRDAIIEALSDG